jgi:hypothetical protein
MPMKLIVVCWKGFYTVNCMKSKEKMSILIKLRTKHLMI